MILGYTIPRAEENIISGVKVHTLRQDRVNRWKPGYEIHHATGNRTPKYNCFLKNKCKSVQQILVILLTDRAGVPYVKMTIDRRRLDRKEVLQVIHNDGIDSEAEFIKFIFKNGHTMWAGKIIHWTDLKY